MRVLLFKNNVHSTELIDLPHDERPRAVNLTIRKGLKWADLKVGETVLLQEAGADDPLCGNEVFATIYDVKVIPFNSLMNYHRMLQLQHDPKCQNYTGLFETMRKVYDGFLQHELVTLVFYELN
jgi:hypothetical protein